MKYFTIGQKVYGYAMFDTIELTIISISEGGYDYLVENNEGKRFWQNESEIFMNKSSAYAEILAYIKHKMEIAKKDYEWEKKNYESVKKRLLQSQKEEKGCK